MTCILKPLPAPRTLPIKSALMSFNQDSSAYEPEFWEFEYEGTPYLQNISLPELMQRYVDLARNFTHIVSSDRYVIPNKTFLSSWYWHRKEHQTRLEIHRRKQNLPIALPRVVAQEDFSDGPRRPRHPNSGDILYRYTNQKWANTLFSSGAARLSSASYYSRLEGDDARRDNELSKTTSLFGPAARVSTADGRTIPVIGDITVNHEGPEYYMYCVAGDWDKRLFDEFGVDRCVVVTNPEDFAKRLQVAASAKLSGWHFHHNPVQYFDPHESALNGYVNHAMAKDFRYAYQREYRFVWLRLSAPESNGEHLDISIGALNDCAELWGPHGRALN